jgi:hypothetical protein
MAFGRCVVEHHFIILTRTAVFQAETGVLLRVLAEMLPICCGRAREG